jgi:hypothetical protein
MANIRSRTRSVAFVISSHGFDFKAAEYAGGQWLDRLPQLLAMEPLDRRDVGSGATECASPISAMF